MMSKNYGSMSLGFNIVAAVYILSILFSAKSGGEALGTAVFAGFTIIFAGILSLVGLLCGLKGIYKNKEDISEFKKSWISIAASIVIFLFFLLLFALS